MNKKFLSAILFGALMVTSTGTFVSCKDYDDDIDRIDQELTDIKSAIAALQSKVDGGKYVTNVAKNGDGITITWNDNSTSTIETIKGDKGDKTIVTIVDGYWAFDGVKSEYPAKGDKGDKGDAGEAASAGHDAQISDNGYWMVWDATKGAYVETEYIAGGATAVAGDHGWTIIVRDQNGKEQSVYIPNSADLVSIQDAMDKNYAHDWPYAIDIFYGLVNTDVEWDGARAVNGKMEAGMYPVLSQDVQIMLNPTGVDGTAYKFGFRDSDNAEPWGLTFGDVYPYAGAKLTRATSASGIWVLPRVIERVPLNELNERADYITQFKRNDGNEYVFALNATSKEDASKVIKSQYIYSFDPTNIGNMKADEFKFSSINPVAKDYYVWNQDHRPNFENYIWTSQSGSVEWLNVTLGQVIYDYKLEIDKTKMTQVNIEKYGLEVSKDGYTFKATKEAAVDNRMYFKLSYILVNGSKHTVDFYADIVAKDIVITDNNIGTLNKPFNATQLGSVAAGSNATQIAALDGRFVYTEQLPFDLKEKLGANYDEWIDAMYQALSTTGWSDLDRAEFLQGQASITGGDPINNDATYNNTLISNLVYFDYVDANGKSCIYGVRDSERLAKLGEIAALEVHFVAGTCTYNSVADTWYIAQNEVNTKYYTVSGNTNYLNGFAIPLNNAFSVQLLAQKEQQPVAALNFKFQLTQPEIDKVGILPQNGLFSQWAEEFTAGKKTADKLYSFGAYDATEMRLPLYEAFDMWIADGANLYRWQNENADWYYLKSDNVAADGITLLGASAPTGWEPQTNNPYQINWKSYNTVATQSGDVMQYALSVIPSVKEQTDATINVDVKYNFFGVYPALAEQLPFYSTGSGNTYQEHPGFRLIFASTIKKSIIKTKEDVYYAKAGTHYVFISNDDIVAKTMLDKEFVLLNGLNASGVPTSRKDLNDARGFNEDIRPFSIDCTGAKSVSMTDGTPISLNIVAGTLQAGETVWADGTTHTNASTSLEYLWNINKPAATIEPALEAPAASTDIKIYEVASRQQFPVGNSTYPNGLPAVEGGYVIQLGQDIDYRQPVEVTFTVTDALGFTNTLKVKVQKLQN